MSLQFSPAQIAYALAPTGGLPWIQQTMQFGNLRGAFYLEWGVRRGTLDPLEVVGQPVAWVFDFYSDDPTTFLVGGTNGFANYNGANLVRRLAGAIAANTPYLIEMKAEPITADLATGGVRFTPYVNGVALTPVETTSWPFATIKEGFDTLTVLSGTGTLTDYTISEIDIGTFQGASDLLFAPFSSTLVPPFNTIIPANVWLTLVGGNLHVGQYGGAGSTRFQKGDFTL